MHKTKQVNSFLLATLFFAGLALAPSVNARDLSVLQTAASYAREDMEKAKAAYEADSKEAARQQQIVENLKKQLAEESKRLEKAKNNTIASQKLYLETQKKYEKAQSALDDAWGKK